MQKYEFTGVDFIECSKSMNKRKLSYNNNLAGGILVPLDTYPVFIILFFQQARMAELADALGSGPSESNLIGVQVSFRAVPLYKAVILF